MGKREEKRLALKAEIYRAAISAFERDGYEHASVDAICAEVGIAKGTFFNHFPSKADVLAKWYEHIVGRSLSADSRCADGIDVWLRPALEMVDLVQQHPRLWAAKIDLATSHCSLARVEVRGDLEFRSYYRELIAQHFSYPPDEIEMHAQLLVAVITGSCREWSVEQAAAETNQPLISRLQARVSALVGLL